jgi:transcriptional regulator with XRE-family HTH domain
VYIIKIIFHTANSMSKFLHYPNKPLRNPPLLCRTTPVPKAEPLRAPPPRFPNRLQVTRKALRITQDQLVDICGTLAKTDPGTYSTISISTVRALEGGYQRLQRKKAVTLATALDVPFLAESSAPFDRLRRMMLGCGLGEWTQYWMCVGHGGGGNHAAELRVCYSLNFDTIDGSP